MARRRNTPTQAVPASAAAPPGSAAEWPFLAAKAVNTWLAAILAVFAVLTCLYNAVTPAATADQHNPDENAHMLYVASAASGHLPVFRAGGADYEAHQPPLYYAACAPVYAATRSLGPAAAMRAVRGVSLLLGLALVAAAFACVRALFPLQPMLALGTAGFVAFLPMNLSLCASVSNDGLTNLVIALALWRLALLARDAGQFAASPRLAVRHGIMLGGLIGVGIWTKTSTLLLMPTVLCACWLLARQGLVSVKDAMRVALLAVGGGGLLGLPWLLRNQLLYGDPLAQHVFESAFGNTAQASDLIRYVFGGSLAGYLWGVAQWTFASFWGVFDSMRAFWGQGPHDHPPSPAQPLPLVYALIALVCLVASFGLVLSARRKPALPAAQGAVLGVFAVLIALTGLAHLRFILVFFQAQGRYWYPALLPLALFFVLGLRGLTVRPSVFPFILLVSTVGLLVLNGYTLGFLLLARFLH